MPTPEYEKWFSAKAPLEKGQEIGAGCERTAPGPSDATDCSRGHQDQNACQRAHNYLTYGLGVIALRLEQGEDPKAVAAEALRLRDRSEEIRSENVNVEARDQ